MKDSSTFTKKSLDRKGSRSMERMTPIKKMNLSLMDEKLYLLNSDIEKLYKKYAEEKSIHERKEKSEDSLLSRIDFLIDEERKIKNKIENNVIQSDLIIKNRSLTMLKSPEIEKNFETSESNRCYTMENSGEDMPYMIKHNYVKSVKMDNKKMKHIHNLNNIDNKCKQKNGMNRINFYSKQNNSVVKNNGATKNNVTNNVCIIINSPKQKEFEEKSYNNYNLENASFSKMNGNNKVKTKNYSINTKEINGNNNCQKENLNINGCLLNNDNDYKKRNYNYNSHFENKMDMDKNDSHLNNEDKDNENLLKINNEINFIKKRLELKLEEENNMGLTIQKDKLQKDAVTQTDQIDASPKVTEGKIIKNNNRKVINYNACKTETSIEDVITPTFKQRVNAEKKYKENQSLRSILYSKQKNLINLVKEIDIRRKILRQKKISAESKKSDIEKINSHTDNKSKKNIRKIDKRCYSKTDNNIYKLKSKVFKAFNHENIINNINTEKMDRKNSSNKRNNSISNKKNLKNELNNLSIDSDESIICDINKNRIINLKKNISLNKRKKNSMFSNRNKTKNKNMRIRSRPNNGKVHYEYDSTPNLINNMDLTFNQSIEKKRELLGLPQDIKDKIRNKIEKIDSLLKNNSQIRPKEKSYSKINRNKNEIKYNLKNKIKDIHKREEKTWNKNNIANKSSRTMYYKKYSKRIINNKNYKKSETNDNNYNTYNIHKKRKFDYMNYPLSNCNKYQSNNPETSRQLFNNKFNNYARFSSTSKDKIINKIASNGSLSSMFSTQTNRTNCKNRTQTQRKIRSNDSSTKSKNKGNYNSYKSNDFNNGTNINKYLKTNKIAKKENQISKEEINRNIVRNLQEEIKDMSDIKLHEKEIKIKRQLAAIRRINQIKEEYKKKNTQLHQVNKRLLYKIGNKNNNSKSKNKNRNKNYQFQTVRRLSEIKKNPRVSFTRQNIDGGKSKNKSKSNTSLIQISNNFKSLNY